MKKNSYPWLIGIGFVILSAVFFHKAFLGYSIQGVDAPLGALQRFAEQSKSIVSFWIDDIFWMGYKSGSLSVNFYSFFMRFTDPALVQFLTYLFAVLFSLLFTYLLLKKFKLSHIASVFGAIAYSFTPPLITLVYSGHTPMIDMLPYSPALFYCLTIAFDKENRDRTKTALSLACAGIAWGIMMTDDVQRGLYFSIFAAFYILFKIFEANQIKWRSFLKDIQNKNVLLDLLKIAFIALFLFLTFSNGFNSWLDSLKVRTAQTQNVNSSEEAALEKWNLSTMWSFHPAELIDAFAFGYHGKLSGDTKNPYWGAKEYAGNSEALGFFVLLFVLIGLIGYYNKNNLVKFFFYGGLIALLFSFGRFWPGMPFYWLFYHLPLMSNFRAPAKFVSIAAFALAILSAFGVEFILKAIQEEKEKAEKTIQNILKVLGVFLGLGIVWLILVSAFSSDIAAGISQKIQNQAMGNIALENINSSLMRMIIFTALSAGIFLVVLQLKDKPNLKKGAIALFILLLTFDLWSINWYYLEKSYIKVDEYYHPDGVISYLNEEYKNDIFRVTTSLMIPNKNQASPVPTTSLKGPYMTYFFPYFHVQSMDITAISGIITDYNNFFMKTLEGSSSRPIQTIDDLVNLNLRLMRIANIKYLITDGYIYLNQPIPIFHSLTNNTNFALIQVLNGYNQPQALFAVKNYLPRLGFYENYVCISNNDEALKYLSDPSFDIEKELVIQASKESSFISSNKVLPIKITEYKSYYIKAELSNTQDGFVLMTSKYDPNWKIYIDGKKVPIYVANYLEMGTFVYKGNHLIEFKFEPNSLLFFVSLFTALAGFLALCAYLIGINLNKEEARLTKLNKML
jgi:hypothetical protein